MNALGWAKYCVRPWVFKQQRVGEQAIFVGESHIGEHAQRSPDLFLTHEAFLFSARLFCFVQLCRAKPDCVFDVGCGLYAPLCRDIQRNRKPFNYVGLDSRVGKWRSNNTAQSITARFGKKNVLVQETVPCIVACEFLEHLDRPTSRRVLRELCNAVKPGGTLLITTPCADNSEPKDWSLERKRYDHVYYWSWKELGNKLEDFGFTVQMWPARFLSDRRSLKGLRHAIHLRYGTVAPKLLDDLVARFGQLIIKSLFAHTLGTDDKPTHMNIVAVKKGGS